MKVVLISDTHRLHNKVEVPDGDLLIHCGDFTQQGHEREAIEFNDWMGKLPHKNKVVIAGNHDWCMTRFSFGKFNRFNSVFSRERIAEITSNYTYLCNSGVKILGLNIWGSPVTPQFGDWAFMVEGEGQLTHQWKAIPDSTNILVTHGPERGIRDKSFRGDLCGCSALRERISRLPNLRLHTYGHIHEGAGVTEATPENNYISANASIVNELYAVVNKPIVMDL